MDHESKTDNTKRRPSVPSALHLRSVFSPRPRPPLARLSRSIFSCRSNRESDNLASNLLTNQHNNFYDIVSSARYVDSIALLKRNECSIVSSHADSISSLDFDNTCEGRFLLSGSSDGTISAYDVSPSGSEYVLDGGISSISSKNGREAVDGDQAPGREGADEEGVDEETSNADQADGEGRDTRDEETADANQ